MTHPHHTRKTTALPAPRVGVTLNLHDSSLGLWFEHVDENAEKAFRAVKALLNRRGFALKADPSVVHYRSLGPTHRAGRRGELEVAVSLSGRHVEVLFFQDVHNVENKSGGRYDFDKMKRMPYLMRKSVELEFRKLRACIEKKFDVTWKDSNHVAPSPLGLTNLQVIEHRCRTSGHFNEKLGRADWYGEYNRRSGDGVLLEQGMPVFFTDMKGRWQQGFAYYNLNNMWWVASGRYALTNKCCSELFVQRPEFLRNKDNRKYSLKRIETLIAKAVQKQDFLRAHALKTVRDKAAVPGA